MDPTAIVGLTSAVSIDPSRTGPAPAVGGFGKALSNAIGALDQLQQQADSGALQLALGQPAELHEVMLAQEQASLGLDLAVQVRNKLIEAYQEITRMQI
jgi:flagellar hook-basal body complex protein FliE